MNIARIDKATGVVLNVEVASQEWLDAHADDPDFDFVAYTPEAPASIGGTHDEVQGFTAPPAPDTITVTVQALADAGLDAKAIEELSKS
jgi:hypothetical protein